MIFQLILAGILGIVIWRYSTFINVNRIHYGHDYMFGSFPTIGLYNAASSAQTLDLSTLPAGDFRDTSMLEYLPASGLPGFSSFPTATFGARKIQDFGAGASITIIDFYVLEDDGLYVLGNYMRQVFPGVLDTAVTMPFNPKRLEVPLPLTYGTTRSFADTIVNDASTGEYEVTTRTHTCNGFGTITFPTNYAGASVMGASSEQGLRVQVDDVIRVYDSGNIQIAYGHNRSIVFIGASSTFTSFECADTSYVNGSAEVTTRGLNFIVGTTGVRPLPSGVPDRFALEQNYPNPFNPSTTLRFDVPEQAFVTLKVYDLLGREVATLVSAEMGAGSYTVNFDAANLAGGLYIGRLSAGPSSATIKMNLIK